MFKLSSKTQVDKKFKLTELYKLIQADKTVKADAANIAAVILTNILNTDTMNFTLIKDVKEIYVFEVVLTSRTIPALFISALDKAINFHTVFVLTYNGQTLLYGAYKEYCDKGIKIGKYYATNWLQDVYVNVPIAAVCLDDIYTAIVDALIPITVRQGETTRDFVNRYNEVVKLQKEVDKLQRMVDAEKQPKKRFELNAQLKELKNELEEKS